MRGRTCISSIENPPNLAYLWAHTHQRIGTPADQIRIYQQCQACRAAGVSHCSYQHPKTTDTNHSSV